MLMLKNNKNIRNERRFSEDPEYIKERQLGKGNFSTVWSARKVNSDGTVSENQIALKEVLLNTEAQRIIANEELKLLKAALGQPCIPSLICYYGSILKENKLLIETEFIDGETLNKFSLRYRYVNPNKLADHLMAILADLLPGIKYLHEKQIIHRDIKPDNIMIDNKNQPKLIDIGLGCFTYVEENIKDTTVKEDRYCYIEGENQPCCPGVVGTPYFMAPEVLLNGEAVYLSDVWSLGATYYYCITGNNVFTPKQQTKDSLRESMRTEKVPIVTTGNIYLDTVIYHMLQKELINRIDLDQLGEICQLYFLLKYLKSYEEVLTYIKENTNSEILQYIFEESYKVHKK